ncbi:MAG TPA: hypothetical protein VLF43_04590 [Candidatus Saccharimonadales bacterium]|nr:hypothetical protein [Candidatus Saccharimonadales bacterium]
MIERLMPTGDDTSSASESVGHELSNSANVQQDQARNTLEADIRDSEEALGIRTTPARLIEAGLAIDKKFFDVAIITGQPEKPERIFGDKEWAGHLAARLLARQYGHQPLTTDFILALHQRFLDKIEPGEVSIIVHEPGRGGQYLEGRHASITCSDTQIAAIRSNPLLRFETDKGSDDPNTGFIEYPVMPKQERRQRLDEICVQFNTDNQAINRDPYGNAALLQRRCMSLHPLSVDFNGRTLRVLKNWALENAGENPSIVDDVDGDLFLSEEGWVESVRAGSMRYAEYKRRAEAGESDPIVLFGLGQKRLRYEELLSASDDLPPPLVGNGWHDHSQYEKFLARLGTMAQDSRSQP